MRVPPVIGESWKVWAEELRKYLGKSQSQLAAKENNSSAKEDGVILWDRVNQEPVVSVSGAWVSIGGGVSDGDKGDITVSSSGTVWTIDAGAVSLSKMADVATSTLFYRTTAGTGAPEVNTLATLKTDLGLTGTNSGDAPPGGSTGEVQYNNAGAFAGAADVEIEGGQLRLPYISTPTTPAASGIKLYGMDVLSGMLAYKNPDGYVHMIQPSLMGFNTRRFTPAPNSNSLVLETSMTLSAIGTASAAVPAVTNLHTMSVRTAFLVTVASTSAIAGWRATAGGSRFIRVGRDANAPGGFVYGCLWGPATGVSNTTSRAFVGVSDWSAAPTDVEPSTRTSVVGMGWDAADANIQFMHNDGGGTCTKIDLGSSFPVPTADTTSVYELQLYSPNSTTRSVNYRVILYNTTGKTIAAETSGTITTNMPPVTTLLCAAGAMSVGGTSSVVGLSNMGTLIATEY